MDRIYFSLIKAIANNNISLLEEKITNINHDCLYAFLRANDLLGYFYHGIQKTNITSFLLEEHLVFYKKIYMQQWLKNERILQQMQIIEKEFRDNSISVIFFKGIIVADRFYGDITKRTINDIDILVKDQDITKAHQILCNLNFTRTSKILLAEKYCIYYTHHFAYTSKHIDLDLHWVLAREVGYKINYEKIWSKAVLYNVGQNSFSVFPDEYELVMQIVSIFKDISLGTIKVKSLLDAYMILKKNYDNIDWQSFLEERQKEGLLLISLNILFLIVNFWEAQQEFPLLDKCLRLKKGQIIKAPHIHWELTKSWRAKILNKLWSFRLHKVSFVTSFLWWLASLPFRLAVYR